MQEMRIYLLNNTKPYREGDEEYSGAWFNCPVDFEEVREKIGVEHEEQIEIADYELPFDLHSDTLGNQRQLPHGAGIGGYAYRQ